MGRQVETHDAATVYEHRTSRPWRDDAAPGLIAAVLAEAGERLLVAMVDDARAAEGGRRLKDRGPVPDWFREGLRNLEALAAHVPELAANNPMVNILTNPKAKPILDALLLDRREGASASLFTEPGAQAIAEQAETIIRQQMSKQGRKDALMAFYVGVRDWRVRSGGDEPTPAEVALLAAASGLEPLDDGLDRARKRWEDRIRIWRRKREEWDRQRAQG